MLLQVYGRNKSFMRVASLAAEANKLAQPFVCIDTGISPQWIQPQILKSLSSHSHKIGDTGAVCSNYTVKGQFGLIIVSK